MKKLLIHLFFLTLAQSVSGQIIKMYDTFDFSDMEMRCGVAHLNKNGVFVCDFKGTYYPSHIYDSTIRKWFIKVANGDSLFYYRNDFVRLYIWDGRSKYDNYGYVWDMGGGSSTTISDKYNGSDTLRINDQVWKPKD